MARTLMGFEGNLYYGTAGSSASTEATNVRDVSISLDPTLGDTSDRSSIFDYAAVAKLAVGLEIEVNNDSADAFVTSLRAAAIAGTPIALRGEDSASGWGPDGDFVIGLSAAEPLDDAQRFTVTATPNKDNRVLTWA